MPAVESAANSTRPAMLLGINGLIQLLTDTPLEGVREGPSSHHLFACNPAHSAWLRQQQEHADLYWIRDRQERSHNVVSRRLGLPKLDWVDTDPFRANLSRSQTKMARALAITALFGSRPVVWVDDKAGPAEQHWAEKRQADGAYTLLVIPEKEESLRPRQMRFISHWLRNLILE